ncbi:hypothetical protein J6A32_05950 [Methanocorpusculum sp.]|nr:hypothetical protein [Methanocorpusculum sp.]
MMDWDKAELLLDEGEELWNRHTEFNEKYGGFLSDSEGALWLLSPVFTESSLMDKAGLGEGHFVRDYIKYLRENIAELKSSEESFRNHMTERMWREYLSVKLRFFDKEEVIRRFDEEYVVLLKDYQNLLSQVKLLKK